jgi:hypothetical protein
MATVVVKFFKNIIVKGAILNFDSIKERNLAHIKACVDKYDFELSLEEVLGLANCFTQSDFLKKTVRLFGEIKETVPVEKKDSKGRVEVTEKVKYRKLTLYSLTQRAQKQMTEDHVISVFKEINLLALFHSQLKYMSKIEQLEVDQVESLMNIEEIYRTMPKIKL